MQGGQVKKVESWTFGPGVEQDDRWTVAALADALKGLATG